MATQIQLIANNISSLNTLISTTDTALTTNQENLTANIEEITILSTTITGTDTDPSLDAQIKDLKARYYDALKQIDDAKKEKVRIEYVRAASLSTTITPDMLIA